MGQIKERCEIIDNCLCIRMPEEIDHHRASNIRESADSLILEEQVKNVVFDFENTNFMDSSGIGIIVGRHKKISCFGGKVYVVNANEIIGRMLKASGLASIIEIEE